MFFSELHEIMVNKVTFVGFKGVHRPPLAINELLIERQACFR